MCFVHPGLFLQSIRTRKNRVFDVGFADGSASVSCTSRWLSGGFAGLHHSVCVTTVVAVRSPTTMQWCASSLLRYAKLRVTVEIRVVPGAVYVHSA